MRTWAWSSTRGAGVTQHQGRIVRIGWGPDHEVPFQNRPVGSTPAERHAETRRETSTATKWPLASMVVGADSEVPFQVDRVAEFVDRHAKAPPGTWDRGALPGSRAGDDLVVNRPRVAVPNADVAVLVGGGAEARRAASTQRVMPSAPVPPADLRSSQNHKDSVPRGAPPPFGAAAMQKFVEGDAMSVVGILSEDLGRGSGPRGAVPDPGAVHRARACPSPPPRKATPSRRDLEEAVLARPSRCTWARTMAAGKPQGPPCGPPSLQRLRGHPQAGPCVRRDRDRANASVQSALGLVLRLFRPSWFTLRKTLHRGPISVQEPSRPRVRSVLTLHNRHRKDRSRNDMQCGLHLPGPRTAARQRGRSASPGQWACFSVGCVFKFRRAGWSRTPPAVPSRVLAGTALLATGKPAAAATATRPPLLTSTFPHRPPTRRPTTDEPSHSVPGQETGVSKCSPRRKHRSKPLGAKPGSSTPTPASERHPRGGLHGLPPVRRRGDAGASTLARNSKNRSPRASPPERPAK